MIEELVEFQQRFVNQDLVVKPGQDEYFSPAASDTDEGRQGDVYFRLINHIPEEYIEVPPFQKVVPGDTIGSDHIFENLPERCWIPQGWDSEYNGLLGPIVQTKPNTLKHPQHGNVSFEECIIQFGYQKDFRFEEELKRRKD